MKNRLNILLPCLAVILFASCAKEVSTNNLSRTTFFADFAKEGSDVMFLECGMEYTEPGISATENGDNVDVETSFSDGAYFGEPGINSDVMDIYTINYSAVNSDGFPGTTSRTVIVACNGDMITNIEGLYRSTVVRVTGETHSNLEYVIIRKTADDTYKLSSAIGGFYELGRGFGPGYSALGSEITYNGTSYSVTDGVFPIWGNVVVVSDFTVDSDNKTITYHGSGNFGSGEFDVVLTQVDL